MVSDKIKALLNIKGKKYKELAQLFGISEQAMRNKFARGSFSNLLLLKVILTIEDLRNPVTNTEK